LIKLIGIYKYKGLG